MSQRRAKIKKKYPAHLNLSKEQIENLQDLGDEPDGPLDWIRTDDDSIRDCLFIQLLMRGAYNICDRLEEVLRMKAQWCRDIVWQVVEAQKILNEHPTHPDLGKQWLRDADFYDDAAAHIQGMLKALHDTWDDLPEDLSPCTATKRHDAAVGGMYPLPHRASYWDGPALYVPKPDSVRPPRRAKEAGK